MIQKISRSISCKKRLYVSYFHCICALICLLIIFLDRISKDWALQALHNYISYELFAFGGIEGFFTLALNRGAAFGFMENSQVLLVSLRIFFVFALIWYIASKSLLPCATIGLFLILAGAISNIVDIFLYGAVVDMIHMRFWGYDYPIFNIADSAITSGSILFIISSVDLQRKR